MSIRSLLAVAVVASAVAVASPLSAQVADSSAGSTQTHRWEFLATSGAVLPTGAQKNAIKSGNLSGAQLSYIVNPAIALTGTFGWARTRDITTSGDPKLDAFLYDLGAEVRANRWNVSEATTFRPFLGAGAGARSYNYRSLNVDATHNIAAYGSVGGEVGYRRVALRIEARDYVSSFKPLVGSGSADTRNDVVLMGGLRINAR